MRIEGRSESSAVICLRSRIFFPVPSPPPRSAATKGDRHPKQIGEGFSEPEITGMRFSPKMGKQENASSPYPLPTEKNQDIQEPARIGKSEAGLLLLFLKC